MQDPRPAPLARLALQTGQLDDHRADLTPADALWSSAYERFLERDRPRDDTLVDERAAALETLCALWPALARQATHVEALAVTVELAAPFADLDRILDALATPDAPADVLRHELAHAAALATPWAPPRPRFPYVYDPDSESRSPIVAILDGPRSPIVAAFMKTIERNDENLAAAIVLGADLDMLDMLDQLDRDAIRASRPAFAGKVEHDKHEWIQRAAAARSRQRLEGAYYGWQGDNFPPGCLEAARGEVDHHVHVDLQHSHEPDTTA